VARLRRRERAQRVGRDAPPHARGASATHKPSAELRTATSSATSSTSTCSRRKHSPETCGPSAC
jgi:hypothetical protein